MTRNPCPLNLQISYPVSASSNRSDPSVPPTATVVSSGENAAQDASRTIHFHWWRTSCSGLFTQRIHGLAIRIAFADSVVGKPSASFRQSWWNSSGNCSQNSRRLRNRRCQTRSSSGIDQSAPDAARTSASMSPRISRTKPASTRDFSTTKSVRRALASLRCR